MGPLEGSRFFSPHQCASELFDILRSNDRGEPPSNCKISRNSHPSWVAYPDKLVKDSIGDSFVENPLISKCVKIELEGLQFQTVSVCNIVDGDSRKVWHTGNWANRGEFRAGMNDPKIACGFWVFKNLQKGELSVNL